MLSPKLTNLQFSHNTFCTTVLNRPDRLEAHSHSTRGHCNSESGQRFTNTTTDRNTKTRKTKRETAQRDPDITELVDNVEHMVITPVHPDNVKEEYTTSETVLSVPDDTDSVPPLEDVDNEEGQWSDEEQSSDEGEDFSAFDAESKEYKLEEVSLSKKVCYDRDCHIRQFSLNVSRRSQ